MVTVTIWGTTVVLVTDEVKRVLSVVVSVRVVTVGEETVLVTSTSNPEVNVLVVVEVGVKVSVTVLAATSVVVGMMVVIVMKATEVVVHVVNVTNGVITTVVVVLVTVMVVQEEVESVVVTKAEVGMRSVLVEVIGSEEVDVVVSVCVYVTIWSVVVTWLLVTVTYLDRKSVV